MFSSVRFSSSGLNFRMLLFVVVAILMSLCHCHTKMFLLKCSSGSPEGGSICGLNVKNMAEFFILLILNVNADKHNFLLEILRNTFHNAKVCLCGLLVGKEDEMLVPIVSENRLPVVWLEVNDMGAGVESHKVHKSPNRQLSVENLLKYLQHCNQFFWKIIHLTVKMFCSNPDGVLDRPPLEVAQHSKTYSHVKEVTCLKIDSGLS